MDKRREVAHVLQRIAFARELLDTDNKVAKDFAGAAWTVRQLRGDIEAMQASGELARTPGLRKAVREVIGHILAGTPVPGLAELEAGVPEGLFEVRKIPGLGPVKIRALWQQLGITTLGELEYACNENRLVGLKGFGAKTQEAVRSGIAVRRLHSGRFRQDQIRLIAQPLVAALQTAPGVSRVDIVGEARRGLETVGSLDVLIVASDAESAPISTVMAILAAAAKPANGTDAPAVDEAESESGAAVPRDDSNDPTAGRDAIGAWVRHTVAGATVTVHVCPDANSFGVHSVLRTGSEAHLESLRAHASQSGLELGARGLTRAGGEVIACPDEESVYAALGVLSVAPERREAGIALTPAAGPVRKRLVRRSDLLGALHNHTVASDGVNTLQEMRAGAIARGLKYLGITDHSKSAFYAKGLQADALLAQKKQIEALNTDGDGAACFLMHGVESDILADGALDYDDEVLGQLDVVVASVHSRLGQKRDEMTSRMIAAARQRRTHVIGHPTGRLLLGRPPSDFDIEAFLDACAQSGCAIELNCNPARLDFGEAHLAMARERGLFVSIAADAHSADALDHLEYGVMVARRAGLTPANVVNCWPLEQMQAWLRDRSAPASS